MILFFPEGTQRLDHRSLKFRSPIPVSRIRHSGILRNGYQFYLDIVGELKGQTSSACGLDHVISTLILRHVTWRWYDAIQALYAILI